MSHKRDQSGMERVIANRKAKAKVQRKLDRDGISGYNNGYLYDRCPLEDHIFDKNVKIRTFLHYSDPDANKKLTVFGSEHGCTFYNYLDRIQGETRWKEGCDLADAAVERGEVVNDSARYFEIALNHFHETDDVDLKHVILQCGTSGYSYIALGYTYTSKRPLS